MRGPENEYIPLADFAAFMPPTVKNPARQVTKDIYSINRELDKQDIPLYFESKIVGSGADRATLLPHSSATGSEPLICAHLLKPRQPTACTHRCALV